MANYGYVKAKRRIDPYEFVRAIHEVNSRRFAGLLKIEPMTEEKHGWCASFSVRVKPGEGGVWFPVGRQLWLRGKTIVMPHGCPNDLDDWVDSVLLNELAWKFDGKIEDDGCEGGWVPKPGRYKTLADFMVRRLKWKKRTKTERKSLLQYMRNDMRDMFLKYLPVEWRPLLGKLPAR